MEPHYGFGLIQTTGLKSGSLYPILERLERQGWVSSAWEQVDPAEAGRPRRRYYRLTPEGVAGAQELRSGLVLRLGMTPGNA